MIDWVSLRSTHPAQVIPFSGKHGGIHIAVRLAAADPMRHDRAENSRPQAMRRVRREDSVKRAMTGIFAAVLAMSASAALAQGKPPLKLGGILDMSGLYADITGP